MTLPLLLAHARSHETFRVEDGSSWTWIVPTIAAVIAALTLGYTAYRDRRMRKDNLAIRNADRCRELASSLTAAAAEAKDVYGRFAIIEQGSTGATLDELLAAHHEVKLQIAYLRIEYGDGDSLVGAAREFSRMYGARGRKDYKGEHIPLTDLVDRLVQESSKKIASLEAPIGFRW